MSESVLHSSPERPKSKKATTHSPGVSDELSNLYEEVSIDNILEELKNVFSRLVTYQKKDNYLDDQDYSEIISLIYDTGRSIDPLLNFHRPDPDNISLVNTFKRIWNCDPNTFPGDASSDLTHITKKYLLAIESDKIDFLEKIAFISKTLPLDNPSLGTLMQQLNIGDSIVESYNKTKSTKRKLNCDNLKDYLLGYILTISNNKNELINELPKRLVQDVHKGTNSSSMYF